ncbi:MAG: hypothetical protein HY316_10045 [Acidobacteria bacterium]|nr:hypothetical protein [Acidobacteriota bacterium]
MLALVLLLTDLGIHLAESFVDSPTDAAASQLRTAQRHSGADYGCPVPGHGSTLFHHHHFPAFVTQVALPIPLVAVALLPCAGHAETVYQSLITPLGRAPPVRS